MQKRDLSFKVDDWVLLREEYVQRFLATHNKGKEVFGKYSEPQKIQKIYLIKKWPYREVLEFAPKEKWTLYENEFRLATEKEIKEYKLKSIFLKG